MVSAGWQTRQAFKMSLLLDRYQTKAWPKRVELAGGLLRT